MQFERDCCMEAGVLSGVLPVPSNGDSGWRMCVESQSIAFDRLQSEIASHLVAELRKLVCRILIQEPAHVRLTSRRPELRIGASRDRAQPASNSGVGTRLEPRPPVWAVPRASKEIGEGT